MQGDQFRYREAIDRREIFLLLGSH